MGRDYKNFMRILLSEDPGEPTLFEPFIHNRIAEQLLWRRGEHMWDTPETYIDTLTALSELTGADAIPADARLFSECEEDFFRAILKYSDDTTRFVCLCDKADTARMAERCGGVCAIGVYGDITANKPTILMDGTAEDAVRLGCAGWFAPNHAEEYWDEFSPQIAILGGLGADYLTNTGPVSIHKRCERLYSSTENRRYALGSGGCLSDGHYLELISMLGIYKKYRF